MFISLLLCLSNFRQHVYLKGMTQLIAIVGPTCTGKTELSLQLAEKLHGEIVALDSRTVYKKMDIGTAKPSLEEQRGIKHHALDILDPTRFFSVSEYVRVARPAIEGIIARGKLPIVCGGTGLYARALLEGIEIPPVPPQEELRKELNYFADKHGNGALHSWLNTVDPAAANRLNVNDRRRIVRALEVFLITGKPISVLASKGDPPFKTLWIGLSWRDRSLHKNFIAERLRLQLQKGLLEEVEGLWKEPVFHLIINNAVNYKEFIPYFAKNTNLENAYQQCIRDNFHLARKQMIWFRAHPSINWIALDDLHSQKPLADILHLASRRL